MQNVLWQVLKTITKPRIELLSFYWDFEIINKIGKSCERYLLTVYAHKVVCYWLKSTLYNA